MGSDNILSFCIFFSALLMYAFPSSSIRMIFRARSPLEYLPVCVSCSLSSRQCWVMLDSRLSMYALQQPGSLLFNLRPTGRTIFTGPIPITDSSGRSRTNVRWLPTPYPNGITQALLISRSPETHMPSIGLEPRKKVAPGLVPVCWMTASHRLILSLSPSSLPSRPLVTCSLWSMKRMILSPDSRHDFICFARSR
jgi:hypothetical protein